MSNEQILFNTCSFFASEKWWKPIISFVYSNNDVFKSENQSLLNTTKKSFTNEQYAKYIEFSTMVTNIVDKTLCSHLGISDKMLENILFSMYEEGNIQSHVIIDTLQKALSFFDFKEEMIRYNLRTEELINEAIIEVTTSLSKKEDLSDPDVLAKKVAEISQRKIDNEIIELVEKGCRQMRGLLDIEIAKPNISGSPQRRPLPNNNSPSRINNWSPKKASASSTQESKTGTNSNSNTNNNNTEHKSTPIRVISRPPPIQSKIHISKISLNSSSSSNSDNENDYYSSASSTPPTSPLSSSAKSAPQSPISTSKTQIYTSSKPLSPTAYNSNSSTNSPKRPKPLISPHNSNEMQLDQEDIERRRQFYIKQRDILANKEHRKPPSHAIVKPQKTINKKMPNTSPAKLRKYYKKIDEE